MGSFTTCKCYPCLKVKVALDHEGSKRWVDILDLFVDNVNHKKNRNIGIAPDQVTNDNSYEVFARLYGNVVTTTEPQFKVSDRVRINMYASPLVDPNKKTFRKGYRSSFTKDVYTVIETDYGSRHMYRLKDDEEETLPGRYYEPELSLFTGEG
mgnify:CR=1 FL=1